MLPQPNEIHQDIVFHASPTIARFMDSEALYRCLMGPVRGGKSSACCIEIYQRALQQKPAADGVRYTRWVVIRNTYRELLDTTIKTWQDWFRPEYYGELNKNTMTHTLEGIECDDGTFAHIEVMFRALDRPDDIKKLLSMEVTGAWINEAREIPKGVVDTCGDRVGQYPAMKDGGPTWRGVICDTNPPDEDHWWYRLSEEEHPPGWEFFKQPGGLIEIEPERFVPNPAAENIENLEPDYYLNRIGGKTLGYIRVYYCAQYGFVGDGKPVYEEYIDQIHCSPKILTPIKTLPVEIGLDFGLTPAAWFQQRQPNGCWIVFDEIASENMGIKRFGEYELGPRIRGEYEGLKFNLTGDPSGNTPAQTDEKTCFQILNAMNLPIVGASTNNFSMRREALAAPMTRLIDGRPGFQISPNCKVARKGLAGGYKFKRMQIVGEERYHDIPDKNFYSHVCEAGQYAMLGGGEGKQLIKTDKKVIKLAKPKQHSRHGWMGA